MNDEPNFLDDLEIDVFEKFYNSTLDEVEYARLKQRIESDSVLQMNYLIYAKLRKKIEGEGLSQLELKHRLQNLDLRQKLSKRKRLFRASFVATFAIALIILVFKVKPNSGVALYEQYQNSEIGLPITMSPMEKDPISLVMVHISKENFDLAITELKKGAKNDTNAYYVAYCQVRLGEDEIALKSYKQLSRSASGDLEDKCLFRMALLHLKVNNAKAKDELNAIAADPENLYSNLSKEIIALMSK